MHKATESTRRRFAFRPLAIAAAATLLLTAGVPVLAQSFAQSGANSTAPNNYLPFNEALLPTSLNFGTDTIYIANGAPGSFAALAGAQLTAGALSIANGGVSGPTGSVGDVTFSGISPATAARTTVLLGGTSNRLEVGNWGTGTLTVSGGALLDATVNAAACSAPGASCFNFIGNGAGSTATLNVTGSGSEVRTLRGFIVGAPAVFTQAVDGFNFGTPGGTTNAFVNVLAGGKLSTQQGTVGQGPNNAAALGTEKGFGTVVVDGPGSQWIVNPNSIDNSAAGITIGNRVGGDGKVTVTNGGKLRIDGTGGPGPNDFLNIATNGGKGALTVSGVGSSVDVVGINTVLQVGRGGASAEGSFSVLAGGAASAVFMNVGRDGAKGSVLIDGAGSLVTMAGLGLWSTNQIGGSAATIGWNGGSGEVTVSNGGRLRVTDGGVDTSTSAGSSAINVGYIGGTGKLFINGANSVVEIVTTSINPAAGAPDNFNPFMAIGRDAGGTGELTISAGGKLLLQGNALSTPTFGRGTNLNIGGYSDTVLSGNGTATVTGPGSELRVEGADAFIAVGRNGTGSLTLNNQALLATTIMNVGRAGSGAGTLSVDNSFIELSGQFTNSAAGAALTLGNRGGTGVATITNNSLVTITNLGSAGASLNLGGTSTNPLGHGELTLDGGSKINFVTAAGLATMTVGRDGSGIATISGVGSQIDLGTGTLNVGQLATGTGTLTINGGGKLLAGIANIGGSSDTALGGSGTATVSGLGSELRASGASGSILVGRGGTGALVVTDQGLVTGTAMAIGHSGGQGSLTMNNSTIELSGQQTTGNLAGAVLAIGTGTGTGTAIVTNNSTVNITNYTATGNVGANLNIGGSALYPSGTGSLVLSGGSLINVLAAPGAASAPTLGTVSIGNNGSGTANLSGGSSINVGAGNLYVARETGSTGTLVMSSGSVINAGFVGVGVNQAGTTSTTLGTPGGTGTLVLNDSTINTSRFELGVGSLLTGNNGVINAGPNGPVIIGGTVSPGNSPGRLRFNCDVTMLFGSKLILEIDQNGASFDIDQLVIGEESVFDLMSLQIIFSFVGDTDPNAFAATPGGFDMNKFLKAGNGDDESAGLQSLFEKNGLANWDAVLNSEMFAFQSTAYDVSGMSFDANNGEVVISASAIPEPASFALVLLALVVLVALSRRRAARRV